MTASIQEGQGSVGKLIASDELYNKAIPRCRSSTTR